MWKKKSGINLSIYFTSSDIWLSRCDVTKWCDATDTTKPSDRWRKEGHPHPDVKNLLESCRISSRGLVGVKVSIQVRAHANTHALSLPLPASWQCSCSSAAWCWSWRWWGSCSPRWSPPQTHWQKCAPTSSPRKQGTGRAESRDAFTDLNAAVVGSELTSSGCLPSVLLVMIHSSLSSSDLLEAPS